MSDDAERIIDVYRRHADAFATKRGKSLMEKPWLDRFLALQPAARRTLDIGCGSGDPIARYLLAQGCAVLGVDSSPELIEHCRRSLPEGEWLVGDMRGLALGRGFTGLVAWDSFFHLTPADQRAMFAVFRAHAAPGAALLFTSGPRDGVAIGAFEGEPLYHSSLDPTEYRALLDAHGFDVVAHAVEDATCGGHTIWLAKAR